MNKLKLDKSEKDLLAAFEGGEFKSVLTPARKRLIMIKFYEEMYRKLHVRPYFLEMILACLHQFQNSSVFLQTR